MNPKIYILLPLAVLVKGRTMGNLHTGSPPEASTDDTTSDQIMAYEDLGAAPESPSDEEGTDKILSLIHDRTRDGTAVAEVMVDTKVEPTVAEPSVGTATEQALLPKKMPPQLGPPVEALTPTSEDFTIVAGPGSADAAAAAAVEAAVAEAAAARQTLEETTSGVRQPLEELDVHHSTNNSSTPNLRHSKPQRLPQNGNKNDVPSENGKFQDEFDEWLDQHEEHRGKKPHHGHKLLDRIMQPPPSVNEISNSVKVPRPRIPVTAQEEFLENAVRKALNEKERADEEVAKNVAIIKEAESKLESGQALIKEVEEKKTNGLKIASKTAKMYKKKAEEAAALALEGEESYRNQIEKGKLEHQNAQKAKEELQRVKAALERLTADLKNTMAKAQAHSVIAVNAAAEAAAEKKLADSTADMMRVDSRVQRLKEGAKQTVDAKKRLEDMFRAHLSRYPSEVPP